MLIKSFRKFVSVIGTGIVLCGSVLKSWLLLYTFFVLVCLPGTGGTAQAQFSGGGQAQLLAGQAMLVRQGQEIELTQRPVAILNGDLLRTHDYGKLRLTLLGGDQVFLAPNTETRFEDKTETKGLARISRRSLVISGRILARVMKSEASPLEIRTPNAQVGVKGTEFVVEFLGDVTNVGTIEGLVSLTSLVSGSSVELPTGTMSTVNAAGEVLPPSEFSGELMRDFEFAGERMPDKDASGERIDPDR